MYTSSDFRAFLVADCGIEHTRVALIDVVDEAEYRLLAQSEFATTVDPPLADVTIAIRQGIAELERGTGRRLQDDGRLRLPQGRDGNGVDAFVATCSAGGGLPILVMAVTADITATSARRAVEGTCAVPFRVVTIEEVLQDAPLDGQLPTEGLRPWWQIAETLFPGAILMVGGIDGGNTAPLLTLARSLAEALPPRPTRLEQEVARPPLPVIFAGNARAQETVRQVLGERVDLRVTDNVRPAMRQEHLLPARQEIARLYEEQVLQQIAGYDELASWSQGPVQLPYMGLQMAARFLAAHHQRQVLALDLGSGTTTAVWAAGEQCRRVVLGNLGLGYGIARVLARGGVEAVQRWLPFVTTAEDVRAWILNRALRPRTRSVTARDWLLQQAVGRAALVQALAGLWEESAEEIDIVVASGGGLVHAPRPAQALLMLLDALQPSGARPSGLVDLYLDRCGLLPTIGVLAGLNPDAAACVLLKDGLDHLAPCLVPRGRLEPGRLALSLELEYPSQMRQQAEVRWGEIAIIPFRWGQEAHLTVKPARRVRVGQGRGGEPLSTQGGDMICGGRLGLVVDARGRPLPLPPGDEARTALWQRWLQQAGAYTEEELAGALPPPPPADEEKEPALESELAPDAES